MNWKSPPSDPNKKWLNRSLELQIILACNWACPACDSFSQFPKLAFTRKGTMTLEQIWFFIGEMHRENAYFGRIRILGGEPSIAPLFPEIVKILRAELVDKGHIGFLEVITNGSHPEKIEPVKLLLDRVRVSGERAKENAHVANLVHTPLSLGYEGKVCSAPGFCGWSLNYWGFFPCSSGAGLARFLDDVPRWQRLSLPTGKTMENWPDLTDLCGSCYHSLRDEDKIKCGVKKPELNKPSEDNQQRLDSWFAGRQPKWEAYYGALTPEPVSA